MGAKLAPPLPSYLKLFLRSMVHTTVVVSGESRHFFKCNTENST